MNQDLRFDRVYLRRQVWPLIEQRWPARHGDWRAPPGTLAEAQALLDEAARAPT